MTFTNGDTSDKQKRLLLIQEEYDRLRRVTALRIELSAKRENCFLALGSALLRLRLDFGLSWEQIAQIVDGISDKAHALRVARRERGVNKRTYDLATSSINCYLASQKAILINFPQFPD